MPTLTGYTEIPQYAFANIQHDAGVLLTGYDVTFLLTRLMRGVT